MAKKLLPAQILFTRTAEFLGKQLRIRNHISLGHLTDFFINALFSKSMDKRFLLEPFFPDKQAGNKKAAL